MPNRHPPRNLRSALVALAALSVFLALPIRALAADASAPQPFFTWPPNAAMMLLLWPLVSGAASLLYGFLDRYPRWHAVLSALAKAGLDLPALLDDLRRIWNGLTPAQLAAAKAAAKAGAKVGAVVLVLATSQVACLPVTPVVPVTPANQKQVDSCGTIGTEHSGFVFGGIGVGAASAAMGGIAAADQGNQGLQQGLAIGAAAAGGLAALAAGGAGLTASAYASGQCPSVDGPLPVAKPAAKAWPADWPPPSVVDSVSSAEGVLSAAGAR